MSGYTPSTQPLPVRAGGRRRRSGHPLIIILVVIVVLVGLAVVADRVAAAYAEDRFATQMQSQAGFPTKPSVTIEGFPFITQWLADDFKTVQVSASNVPEGHVTISSINATLSGFRPNKAGTGATVDQLNGTALISFPALASAAGQSSLDMSNAGGNKVKVTASLGPLSGTAILSITLSGGDKIIVKPVSVEGIPLSAIGSALDFTVPIPSLPLGMSIQSLSVSGQGVLVRVTGSHLSFGSK